jgi:hypothetical protein
LNELKVTGSQAFHHNVQKRAAAEERHLTPEELWLQIYKPALDDLHQHIAAAQGSLSTTKLRYTAVRQDLTTDPTTYGNDDRVKEFLWEVNDEGLRNLPAQQRNLADLTQQYMDAIDKTKRDLLDSGKVGKGALRERILTALRRLPGEGIEEEGEGEGTTVEIGPE